VLISRDVCALALQLSWDFQSPTKSLDMFIRFRRGEGVKPREPCTDDLILQGSSAYALHRRGMVDLLTRYWPEPEGVLEAVQRSMADPGTPWLDP
jgi:hypothetical protein